MSKSAWRRSSDEARAGGGGNFFKDKSDKAAKKEESTEEQINLTRRRDTHETFLELGDKGAKTIKKMGRLKALHFWAVKTESP